MNRLICWFIGHVITFRYEAKEAWCTRCGEDFTRSYRQEIAQVRKINDQAKRRYNEYQN